LLFCKAFLAFLGLRAEVGWVGGVARVAAHLPCWSENRVNPHPTTAPTDPSPDASLIAKYCKTLQPRNKVKLNRINAY